MFNTRKDPIPIPPVGEIDQASDRRRFPRVAMPVFFRSPRLRNVREPVVDVGQGGLRVFSDEPLMIGTRLELELFLPNGQELRGMARVCWIGALPPGSAARYDVGFEIFDMPPEDRDQLTNLVNGAS